VHPRFRGLPLVGHLAAADHHAGGGDQRDSEPNLERGDARKRGQLVTGAGELGQAGLHLGEPPGDQAGDVNARRLAAVADVQELPVLEGEPGGLGMPDEREALQDRRVVVAVARRVPGRGREQALALPEPDRLGRYPCPVGRLADPNTAGVPMERQLNGPRHISRPSRGAW